MSDTRRTDHSKENDKTDQKPKWWTKPKWLAIAGFTILGIAILIVAYACQYYVDPTKRTEIFIPAVLLLLTLAAIITQAVIYVLQWQAMRETLRQNKSLIRASQRQARASEKSLKASEDMFYQGERAYLALDGMQIISETWEAGKRPTFHYKIKNGGRTPAFRVTVAFQYAMIPNKKPIPEIAKHFEDHEFGNISVSQHILPADFTQGKMDFAVPIDPQKFIHWEAGQARLHIFFKISYFDIRGINEQSIIYSIEFTKAHGVILAECSIPDRPY